MKACILDYGFENVRSVFNLMSTVCNNVIVSNDLLDIQTSSHIVLPGVGAFEASMRKIKATLPLEGLKHALLIQKKPFLGICVGMQVMAEYGFEFGQHDGFGWIPGEVKPLEVTHLPLPHIGWNNVRLKGTNILMKGIENMSDFYFVHSFVMQPTNLDHVVATTDYGQDFCSIVQKENLFGVQFHPEKSQKTGQKLIENFLKI